MSDIISFGRWLRQQRRSRGLTQVALAELIGCATVTLRTIETDDARPSKQLAVALARVLDVADNDVAAFVTFARNGGQTRAVGEPPQSVALNPSPQSALFGSHLTNLPAQMTGLIGRMHEVDAVRALLRQADVRLVTLTGPGGTGKTRVAVQVASGLPDAFPDGVYFVDLAAISDSNLVLATIAQTLGVSENAGQPIRVTLAAALGEMSLLVLLDNFEQVVEAAPFLVELLVTCPHLKLLVTSRITLGITGEYEWPVPPLALPNRLSSPQVEQCMQYDAVRLFDERSRAVDPQFAITTRNVSAVAEICQRLDGLPLAIELAAARTKVFQPQALLARLDHRLTLLSGGRDRPTRQQTMWSTIAWSYHLLAPAEQVLFGGLGVFKGGATLAALGAVCGDMADDLLSTVTALVNHSLLRPLSVSPKAAQLDPEPRFGMLETIREYALDQLAARGEVDQSRRAHADYFLTLAESTAAQWDTPTVAAAIAQCEQEHDNMRVALQWARDNEPLLGLQLAGALGKFWKRCGYATEGRAWLTELLALNEDTPDAPAIRLRALEGASWLASDQHDFAHATQLMEQSMALRRALGETVDESMLLINTALSARAVGQYKHATALLEDAVARHRTLGNRGSLSASGLGLSLYMLGLVLREQGDFERARTQFEACVELHRELGDQEGIAFGMLALSDIARDQGHIALVQTYCEQSLATLQAVGVQTGVGFTLHNLALAAYKRGDLPRAFDLISECQSLFRAQKAEGALGEILITFGQIAQTRGDAAAAHAALTEAVRIAAALGPRLVVVFALETLAWLEIARNGELRAVQLLTVAATMRTEMGTPMRPIDQPMVEQAHAIVRSTLGRDMFTTIWRESANMPLERLLSTMGIDP